MRPRRRDGQPVASAWNRDDPVVAQYPAQRGNLDVQVVFFDRQSGPNLIEQRVLGDRLTGRRGEYDENVERTSAKWRRRTVPGQTPTDPVEPEWAEHNVPLHRSQHERPFISGNLRSWPMTLRQSLA